MQIPFFRLISALTLTFFSLSNMAFASEGEPTPERVLLEEAIAFQGQPIEFAHVLEAYKATANPEGSGGRYVQALVETGLVNSESTTQHLKVGGVLVSRMNQGQKLTRSEVNSFLDTLNVSNSSKRDGTSYELCRNLIVSGIVGGGAGALTGAVINKPGVSKGSAIVGAAVLVGVIIHKLMDPDNCGD